jgi:hypothetical protein
MGEIQNQPFQLSFNASLKIDFQGSRVTSDGGLVLLRELDGQLGFGELIEQHLTPAVGRIRSFPLPTFCGNPSTVAWLVTKTSTMPRGSPRPDLPGDQLGKGLGSGRRSDLPVADL